MNKVMVMIPTYNERENIKLLVEKILGMGENYEVVVVDDDSPDGTADIVREMAKIDSRVHLVLRKERRGRGYAGAEGFLYAVNYGVDYICEMDADFSHNPDDIPRFVEEIKDCDIVIGSRHVKCGKEIGRSFVRKFITSMANLYIRIVYGMDVRDCTSGFRLFKREALAAIELENVLSWGPSIVQEVLYQCYKKGFRIKEAPILFEDRRRGKSTFNVKIILKSLWMVPRIRFHYDRKFRN